MFTEKTVHVERRVGEGTEHSPTSAILPFSNPLIIVQDDSTVNRPANLLVVLLPLIKLHSQVHSLLSCDCTYLYLFTDPVMRHVTYVQYSSAVYCMWPLHVMSCMYLRVLDMTEQPFFTVQV